MAVIERLTGPVPEAAFKVGESSMLTWDTAVYWAWMYQLFVQGFIRQPAAEIFTLGERYRELNGRVQQLFIDWSETAPPRPIYVRGDMTRMRFMQLLGLDLTTRP